MFHPYFKLLQRSGLEIKPLSIRWHITSYNRFINQMGRWKPVLLQRWFDVGAFITCALIVPFFTIYFTSLYQMFKSSSVEDYNNSLLIPVVSFFS